MYLIISDTGVELVDADHLRDLYVLIDGINDSGAAESLRASGFGVVSGDHCWLETERLRRAGEDSACWLIGFAAMVRFAARHGWTNEDHTRIRAHLVRE